MQVHQLLRRRRVGAREHLAHLRVLRGDLLALLIGQRLDVQHQRLLDLRAVEEVVDGLRRDLGMVGQHERRREDRVVLRRREHRPGVDLTAAGDAVVAALQRRDDRAALGLREQVRREHALQQRVLAIAVCLLVAQRRRVLDEQCDARAAIGQRVGEDLRLALEVVEVECDLRRADAELHAPLDGAVLLAGRLQEAHLTGHDGAIAVDDELHLHAVEGVRLRLRVVVRIDDPERRRRRVLRRAGRVRVQGVALEQQRVDEPLEVRLRRRDADVGRAVGGDRVDGAHVSVSSASAGARSSRSSKHASRLCSPRARLYLSSAATVSLCSSAKPDSPWWCLIIDFHVATGSL